VAKAGDEIANPRTGQRMVFLETGEESDRQSLRIDSYNPPGGGRPEPEHVHPFLESGAEVLSGSLRFSVGGEERSVKAGESITIPPGVSHLFWNDGGEAAHSVGWFRPALKIDRFFETFFGLAQDGKFNDKGLPSLLQLAVMVPRFGDEIRLVSPPWAAQRAIFGMLAPSGKGLGYRGEYPYPYHGGSQGSPAGGEERSSASSRPTGVVVAGMLAFLFALFLLRRRGPSNGR
jgi:mannose-6-phosphate isomerase-like protein (cupin superfamily)